jgi:prepilin-type processing-associated H-X9-DG protein
MPVVVILAVVGGVVMVCGGILVALLLPAVHTAREAARRASCSNNLKQISLALVNYESVNGCFPPAYVADKNGNPMHSWRVLILPYLERQDLYQRYNFDEPWDSPRNRSVTNTVLPVYQCPSAAGTGRPETNYVMIVGPETIASGNSAVRVRDIRDGTSYTIMVVETAEPGISWAEPRDLNFDELNLQINGGSGKGISSRHRGGANAAFCDGSVHFLRDSIDRETLQRLINRQDGMPVDRGSY